MCSGGAECPDGSDETAAVCSTHFCPEPGFRCDYGACVLRNARCDGKMDCIDGSDEKEELCSNLTAINARPSRPPVQGTGGALIPFNSGNSLTNIGSIITQFRDLLFRQESQITELRKENLQLRLNILDSAGKEAPRIPTTRRPTVDNEFLDPISGSGRRPAVVTSAPIRQPGGNSTPRPIVSTPPPPPISNAPREEGKLTVYDPIHLNSAKHTNCVFFYFCPGDCDAPQLPSGRVSDVFSRRYDNRFVKNGEEIIFECLAGTTLIGVNSTYCINGQLLQELPLCTSKWLNCLL